MKSERELINSGYYYIKPAANHILTVGKGIIKDAYTAILELVKNSYDADAEKVTIKIVLTETSTKITVEDDGHGMDFKTVTDKWMVPSIAEKQRQRKSLYKKRSLQGRKGIGRYAASILGNDLFLRTTDKETLTTTELLIDWNDFLSDSKFLEDVDILIESYKDDFAKPGTYLSITGDQSWSEKEIDNLIASLKSLLSPFDEIDNDFKIFLEVEKYNSEKYGNYSEQIKPLPFLEYYHYRVSGTVELVNGELLADLILENKHLINILPKKIQKKIILEDGEKYCGKINIDIRAFDLDEELPIKDQKISREEARKQLKELPGVAVIREGFRVRPYGDRKVDWLSLNERRYNNPTLRLSSNQVAGYVTVQQEDDSHLIEKATREGFKEDDYYQGLQTSILQCLVELETLRYDFRKTFKKGGRKEKSINEKLDYASDFKALNYRVNSILAASHVSDDVSAKVKQAIEEETKEKAAQLEEIKKTIAQYQGQVTLGRIMNVVFHEGRKPLNALKQHPKFITSWSKEFVALLEKEHLKENAALVDLSNKIIDRLNDNKIHAEAFINIFKKLEPLANNKRPVAKEFNIYKPIESAFKLFDSELAEKKIVYSIKGDTEASLKGWELDIHIAFANLIENSIYWLSESNDKRIEVIIVDEIDKLIIDYSDSGSGIDESNIASQNIFDPGFSTKTDGTGLGLSIAGEALERNHGLIKAISNPTGANFIIEFTK